MKKIKNYFLLSLIIFISCNKDPDTEYILFFQDDFWEESEWVLYSTTNTNPYSISYSNATITESFLHTEAYQEGDPMNASATRFFEKDNSKNIHELRCVFKGINAQSSGMGSNKFTLVINNLKIKVNYFPWDLEGDLEMVYKKSNINFFLNGELIYISADIETEIPSYFYENNFIEIKSVAACMDNYCHASFYLDFIKISVAYSSSDNNFSYTPTCDIIYPQQDSEYEIGDIIVVSVISEIEYGNIASTDLFVDNKSINALNNRINYFFESTSLNPGNHFLKVKCKDEFGAEAADSLWFSLKLKTDEIQKDSIIDIRDGKVYKTVQLGNQVWMAENLNYETEYGSWLYNNDSLAEIWGRLYKWEVAVNACPNGWHLPSDDEWKTLEMHLGMSEEDANDTGMDRGTNEGDILKSKHGWIENGNGIDEVGFAALPSGYYLSGDFYCLGESVYFWANNIIGTRGIHYNYQMIFRSVTGPVDPNLAFSVRCVKD
ncbi:MAG TPA: FISUMP domain-containing protein [Tenuifilaceae bacterium]|nr:FISUMP domain-containing protein [Tenuifilaceae bacterium]HPE18569.1 FISUMP domain-containing protein [Tenuifilaceae bacterium]HPJ46112.1 FISUMP domain-containing protein [Tenuifilaceae bacterium]HPQ34403.1 FISUMP domain-containing protein [Tenuifilaceae bacterium]HRX67799.1 FISUMP domain-containing protein [Tenuifilaceae bacterium]